ncbi:hypothetical protein Tco_0524126 [Tanacetum coccineum]
MGNDSLRSSPGRSTWVLELLVPLLELNRFGILLGELEEGQVVSSVIGGILSIEARDMDIKILSAPESNNTLARCWHDKLLTLAAGCFQWLAFCFCSSWSNEHLVASLTLDSARSCVMQDAFLTHGKASSIPTIFSWGGSISPDGFLPSIMLLLVIIIAVVIVVVTVVWVAVVVGKGSSIIKLLFVIIGFEAVTFPSILLGNPLMKTSISFSEFDIIVGHKTANSWNLLM